MVDDHSTDRTREIAKVFSDRGVSVIDAPTLPTGWTGKNNALIAGGRAAQGEWLLFTDADTVHLPGSLARALAEAREHQADMLSYSPEQIAATFWEMAVLPVVFAELARQYPPSKVRDPQSPVAAANGQYILISREAYDAVGGHTAIAGEILEDVALARAIKRSGKKIFFRYAADVVRTRMYRNFAQLREGWTKNLALLFPNAQLLALTRSMEFMLVLGSTGLALASASKARWGMTTLTGSVALTLFALFLRRISRAHFPRKALMASFLGLPVFSLLLFRSEHHRGRGVVEWRGRVYERRPSIAVGGNHSSVIGRTR